MFPLPRIRANILRMHLVIPLHITELELGWPSVSRVMHGKHQNEGLKNLGSRCTVTTHHEDYCYGNNVSKVHGYRGC